MTWHDGNGSGQNWGSSTASSGWGPDPASPGWGSAPRTTDTGGLGGSPSAGGPQPPQESALTRPRLWLLALAVISLIVGTVLLVLAAIPGAITAYVLAVAAILLAFRFRADDNRRRAEEPRYSPSPTAERFATGALVASLVLIVPAVFVIATWVARL